MESPKFCANCGSDLGVGAKFCPKCGASVSPAPGGLTAASNAEVTNSTENFTDKVAKNNPFPVWHKKAKEFISSHKKQTIIVGSALGVLVIGVILFNALWDFTKLEWDGEYSDINLEMTSGRKLELNVKAEDREKQKISEIEFSGDGEIEADGTKVTWTLPSESGTYKIVAKAPSGKTIEKEIEYVNIESDGRVLNGVVEEEVDEETTDSDGDGIMDAEEKKLGTNPYMADTDMDGLLDSQELDGTGTDPLKADTDGDGILDGDEIALGLDPTKADSRGDGVKDGDRELSYDLVENNVNVSINGKGNIASTSVDIIKSDSFSKIEGVASEIYDFSTAGDLKNARVTITYNVNDLFENGIPENELTLYYFDDEKKTLEKVESTVDSGAKTISAELTHFSKYVLGKSEVEVSALSAQILFVIDNSISMYTEAQVLGAGYESVNGADGNDSGFKRFTLTNNMIDKLTGSYKFSVAEFSGNYVNLQKFTDDKTTAKTAVDSMKLKWNSNAEGTNIATAMTRGISEFSSSDKNGHYMILLTDGQDTSDSFSLEKSSIIGSAKEKDIKICTIGLGEEIDTEILNEISEETGCDFYNANDSSALDEIYNVISAGINFGYVDTDDDNETDGMISADSGFIATRDGFSFGNYGTELSEGGHCYGMALFAMLRYQGQLPRSLEAKKIGGVAGLVQGHPEANAYKLSASSYFRGTGSLYDFKFTTAGLKLLIQDKDLPADYRDQVEDDVWKMKADYKEAVEAIGGNIKVVEANSAHHALGGDKEFSKVESAKIKENNTALTKNTKTDEWSLLDAIWRLFILQWANDNRTDFSSKPDAAWEELTSELKAGQPTVLVINHNHAINATKIVTDNKDANKFKIGVYNNNFPGETQYIEVTRTKTKATISPTKWVLNLTNNYIYSFKYDSDGDGEMEDTTIKIANPVVE